MSIVGVYSRDKKVRTCIHTHMRGFHDQLNLRFCTVLAYNQMNYVKYLSFKLYSLFLATSITYISVESVVMLKAAGFLSEKPLLEL